MIVVDREVIFPESSDMLQLMKKQYSAQLRRGSEGEFGTIYSILSNNFSLEHFVMKLGLIIDNTNNLPN